MHHSREELQCQESVNELRNQSKWDKSMRRLVSLTYSLPELFGPTEWPQSQAAAPSACTAATELKGTNWLTAASLTREKSVPYGSIPATS
jgi:hypothetical protein